MKKITAKSTVEEIAAIVSEHLRSRGLQASLVGGAVVSIYSNNEYQSRDLDFISPNEHKQIAEAMAELGFTAKGKDFWHDETEFTIEFPSGPIAIGEEVPIKPEGEIENKYGKVSLLSPTQCVMDRLAWYYHNNDRQCLDQAIAVAKNNKVNFAKIKKWSIGESAAEKYEIFLSKLK